METINKKTALNCLQHRWDAFLEEFNALFPEQQQAYLKQQGYTRFADLLAHFAAWWQVGMQVIEKYRVDPAYHHPEIDVDAFNADVVKRVCSLSEARVLEQFQGARQKFIDLANDLTDEEYRNPKIARQINIELLMHMDEHAIK